MMWQARQFFPSQYHNTYLIPFVVSATLASYNFHWFLTRPKKGISRRGDWTIRNKILLFILMSAGMIGSAWFFLPLKEHWIPIGASVLITFIYSAPKIPAFEKLNRIAVAKTLFLTIVWVYVTTILYFFVKDLRFSSKEILFCLSRFFLIYCICILFDYRDREDDRKQGLSSLPVIVSDRTLTIIFYGSAALFVLATLALYWHGFSLINVVLLLAPGLIVTSLYNYARTHYSDFLFYFVLDGMMALSSLLTLLISF